MENARFAAIFISIINSLFIMAFALWGKHWSAEREKARERRLAGHRMNARLLRLNI
jgi:hypothetical protein